MLSCFKQHEIPEESPLAADLTVIISRQHAPACIAWYCFATSVRPSVCPWRCSIL